MLASLKVTLQSSYSRGRNSSEAQKHLFNVILFGTIGLMFVPTLFDGGIHPYTLIYGFCVGALSVLFQFSYLKAFSTGRVTLTVIVNNFSMLIPMVYSIIAFGEGFGYIKIIDTSASMAAKNVIMTYDIHGALLIILLIFFMILLTAFCKILRSSYTR